MGKYEEALAGLNAAQKLAVTTTEGPVLVIAGPGTGKTQLLTTRIAHILATTDTTARNILCLTFTESAAVTMRERLAGMIGQDAYDVTISTYHAFGSDLIRRFPDYFVSDTRLEPADDLAINEIFGEIVALLAFDNPLRFASSYLNDIKTLVSDAKRALLTPDDLRAVAASNLQFIKTASPTVKDVLGIIPRLTKKDIPAFSQLFQQLQPLTSTDLQGTTTPVESLPTLLLQELEEAIAAAEESGKATPLTQWKNNWLAKDGTGAYIIGGTKANEKIQAAATIYQTYLEALEARGLFDYDDMILRAVRALEQNSDLRYTLQEQYLYILLDEFQDTNGAQLKIVQLLTDNPVHEGRPNVMAVGDDDQAIYAFQGASYSHMLQFNDMYRDVTQVALTENYRSHSDVLHVARGVAEQIEERLHHHFPAIEKTLVAASTTLPKQAVIERREAASDVMQFAWVAKRIKKLLANGLPASEIAVLAPQHRYLEPLIPFLQQEHIPVRYDKRENILDDANLNQLLRMSELCLALAAGEKQASDALWAEVLSFSFWGLPTSLIWQLSWQSNDDASDWSQVLMNQEACKPIALFFIRLSQLLTSETLETILDYLIGSVPLDLQEPGFSAFTSPFYDHYFAGALPKPQSSQSTGSAETLSLFESEAIETSKSSGVNAAFWDLLSHLIVLRTRLREYKRGSSAPLYLQDFIDFVALHRAAEIKILNTNPYTTGTEAVQAMTAFKAKGMEFTAVFILAVNDEAWGSRARGAGNRISLPPNMQFIRYAGATNDERLRLFYVAVTRAKTQLFLASYTSNFAGKALTHLKYLSETTDENYVLQSPLLPEGKQTVLAAEEVALQPTTELAAYWQQRHERALSDIDLQVLLQERLQRFQLSPTHVNDFADLDHCGPAAFFMRTILRFPQAPLPAVQFGNAMHETLEWIHISTKKHDGLIPVGKNILAKFEERLLAKRLSVHDSADYLARGQAALAAYARQRLHTISPNNVVEYNFRGEGVFTGKAHLTGKIDKLIIDKKQRTITIIDYKTGKSHSRWTHDIKMHKYQQQLYLYRALVEGSHTYAGYTVTDAYLEFVEPDEAGVIQELHLAMNDTDYKRTRKLAEAVWRHIHGLQLPDSAAYSAGLAGMLTLEDDIIKQAF